MKMVKSLLLGTAAGIVAVAGAQAADMPVKAAPVQYVKICSLYGDGFYYIPGTDTCLKMGGYLRASTTWAAVASRSVTPRARPPRRASPAT
ncbi:MAG TPA: porin [Tepidisphaeraceae bacterium]